MVSETSLSDGQMCVLEETGLSLVQRDGGAVVVVVVVCLKINPQEMR
jgi:hypothetical protein